MTSVPAPGLVVAGRPVLLPELSAMPGAQYCGFGRALLRALHRLRPLPPDQPTLLQRIESSADVPALFSWLAVPTDGWTAKWRDRFEEDVRHANEADRAQMRLVVTRRTREFGLALEAVDTRDLLLALAPLAKERTHVSDGAA